jgi:AraC-like DNA-binding protein
MPEFYTQICIMIINSSISAHPCLNDFIARYTLSYAEVDNTDMTFPMFANYESCLYFYLGDLPQHINNSITKNETITPNRISLLGLFTHSNGYVKLQGKCRGFIIEFKPNGFNMLFGIAANEICNHNFPANEVLGKSVEYFYEQLLDTVSFRDMALLADKFLTGFLKRKKIIYINEGISKISFLLLTTFDTISITKYASLANMSMRNFDRRFTEQVGTSPKLFCRLLRFNKALQYKITHSEKRWTDIAYECSYFDQMHLIKEFKAFTNESPSASFNGYPDLLKESFNTIERIDE